MNVRSFFVLLTHLIFFAPRIGAAQSFVGLDSPLGRAQQAYVAGDFKAMAVNLRQTLEQNPYDSVVKDNALSLLAKAYENSADGLIPADWHLPDEIKQMKVGVKYKVKDGGHYNLRVYGSTKHRGSIAQMQVIQYPDHVVLDKNGNIGHWNLNAQIDSLDHEYELSGDGSREPIAAGLYLLNMTLNDGTQTKGWFILEENINSTATPKVSVPTKDQVFKTGHPTFKWSHFYSPQYRPFERRSLWAGVSRAEPPDYKWDEVFGHFEYPPTSEELTVDANGEPMSLAKLNPGSYVFFIDYHERRNFGDLVITRDSITGRDFKVK